MKKKITCLVLVLIMCMSFGTSAVGIEYQEMGSLAGNPNLYEDISLERQFSCHAMGEQWLAGDVGDWDLEPIRPAVGLALVIAAECNPV